MDIQVGIFQSTNANTNFPLCSNYIMLHTDNNKSGAHFPCSAVDCLRWDQEWVGSVLFPSPKKSQIDQSINAA